MKEILNYLFEHKTLSYEESKKILRNIAQGKYNESEIAAFLAVYIMRSITVGELTGFRDALLELCKPVDLEGMETVDLCGTGGDTKNTFNVSTLASFVTAGAGAKVAKHGNYGVSSACGSPNVMEYFGYQFTNNVDELKHQISENGICFLHAPLFHPAMKNVAPIRRNLRVKTFFNMLGPMVNPAFPKNQLVGVFNLEVARLYSYLYQKTDKNFAIVHGLDGYDEVSLTSDFKVISNAGEQILSPADLNFETYKPEALIGGNSVEEAAKIFINILQGKGTDAQNNVVIANAGLALNCINKNKSREENMDLARESLVSGKALEVFKKTVE
jgi:anthranilate phosphoribosyltransferase